MFRFIIFIVLFIIHTSVNARTPAADLTQLLSSIQTLQANFTQTINDNKGKQSEQSIGHMALERPGKFRWSVTKPVAQLVVANGTRLWIYDPQLEQVTIRLLNKEVDNTPVLLLSNPAVAIEKNYTVQSLKNAAFMQWFVLLPKNRDSMLAFIKMGFANGQIREMELRDHLGHNTVIEFYNVSMNCPVSASLFSFKPPAHTDVIDETQNR
jgi:outer membrane lipoprotein carrier protein